MYNSFMILCSIVLLFKKNDSQTEHFNYSVTKSLLRNLCEIKFSVLCAWHKNVYSITISSLELLMNDYIHLELENKPVIETIVSWLTQKSYVIRVISGPQVHCNEISVLSAFCWQTTITKYSMGSVSFFFGERNWLPWSLLVTHIGSLRCCVGQIKELVPASTLSVILEGARWMLTATWLIWLYDNFKELNEAKNFPSVSPGKRRKCLLLTPIEMKTGDLFLLLHCSLLRQFIPFLTEFIAYLQRDSSLISSLCLGLEKHHIWFVTC